MNDTLWPFFAEKPYPKGYEAPDLFEHYQGLPLLNMPEIEKEDRLFLHEMPDSFVIRAEVQEVFFDDWPIIKLGAGKTISLSEDALYTEEGKKIVRHPRIRSLSLLFQGLCFIPNERGVLLPWGEGPSLLPFTKGEIILTHDFLAPPTHIHAQSPMPIFPLGGIHLKMQKSLCSKNIYFFVESTASSLLPQVKLLTLIRD